MNVSFEVVIATHWGHALLLGAHLLRSLVGGGWLLSVVHGEWYVLCRFAELELAMLGGTKEVSVGQNVCEWTE